MRELKNSLNNHLQKQEKKTKKRNKPQTKNKSKKQQKTTKKQNKTKKKKKKKKKKQKQKTNKQQSIEYSKLKKKKLSYIKRYFSLRNPVGPKHTLLLQAIFLWKPVRMRTRLFTLFLFGSQNICTIAGHYRGAR